MRKCALPTELAHLTRDQIAQLDGWLDRFTFAKVQNLFLETHGISIGRGKLNRYNARRLKARALSNAENALTAADLIALKNGTPIPDDHLNKELLLRRTLQLVPRVTSAFHLRELHQIATYEQRRAMIEREQQLRARMNGIGLTKAELRQRELEFRQYVAARKLQLEALYAQQQNESTEDNESNQAITQTDSDLSATAHPADETRS
jgi:hypothetical protein